MNCIKQAAWNSITLIFIVILFSGCAGAGKRSGTIEEKYVCQSVDECIRMADYGQANAILDKTPPEYLKGNDRLLYYFDKGFVLQVMGNYKDSSKSLHEAETIIDDLYTKSISAEATSFFTNDLALPYEGEDFEQVMVHIIKSLNFMYTGDYTGARVEARKVDGKLNRISEKMEGQNSYKEDALARYISGFSYEANGELNSAYIDYKKAYGAYKQYSEHYGTPIPDAIKKDLLRVSEALGFKDQYDGYKDEFGFMPYTKQKDLKGKGEALFVFYDGRAPIKQDAGNMTPVFVDRGSPMISADITTEEDKTYASYVVEDVTAIAIKNLAQKMDFIQAKNLARGIVKEVAVIAAKDIAKEALKNTGFGFVADIAGDAFKQATNLADTRSWQVLPSRFHMIRIPVDGKQSVKLRIYMRDGSVREKVFKISVKPGKKKAIPVYCFM